MKNILKSIRNTFTKGERGMVFPIVLILLLLVGLLIPPLMGLITTGLVTGGMYENSSYELYAADAGVMDAIWFLQEHANEDYNDISPDAISKYFPDGEYTYVVQDKINGKTVVVKIVIDGDGFLITSTAKGTDGSTTTIETRVQFPLPPPPIMMAVGALDGNLKVNADVGTTDNWVSIYANGDIELIGSGEIYGDAYYTYGHSLKEPIPDTFYGTGITTVELELVKGILPENPEILGNEYIRGSMTISETGVEHKLGPIYIDGDLTISDPVQVELTGTVWVSGKIQINAGAVVYGTYNIEDIPSGADSLYSKYESGDPYFIISDWSDNGRAISVNGGTPDGWDYKVEAVLYAPYGYIYVGGSSSISGAVVGGTVDILGDSRLTFPLPFQPVKPKYQPMETDFWKIT